MESDSADSDAAALADGMHQKRRSILSALTESEEGKLPTSEITSRTGLPNNTVNYHFPQLIEKGLLEKVEEEQGDNRGIPANVYRVTQLGEDVVEELRDSGASSALRMKDLRESIEVQKQAHQALRKTVDDQSDELEDLAGRVDETETALTLVNEQIDRVDDLEGRMTEFEERLEMLETKMDSLTNVIGVIRENEDYLPDPE